MSKKYFISFVGEGIFNPKYRDYTGGRIEVSDNENHGHYPVCEEIRYFTNNSTFWEFMEKWDFKDITQEELNELRETVKRNYYNT